MSKHTQASIRHRNGNQLSIQHNETDSPIIPVAQLEQLHKFKPDAVDWVINQTQIEADHRRSQEKRINTFVFTERVIGQVFAFLIGISGIIGGCYVAVHGESVAGASIAGASLTGLMAVFIAGRRSSKKD